MSTSSNFIRDIIEADLASGATGGRVVTRFPPEPNGYLHIGHAKAICLDFGFAADYNGQCHLRFDDTNPETEDPEYVEAIKRDVHWLGFDWGEHLYHASDYFQKFYDFAEQLVKDGKAYVDSQSEEQIRKNRGTVTEPGTESPYRDRTPDENLDLFRRMKAGEFRDGEHVLRAKGDMASPNMKMRDPLLYRIRHASHYRTGDAWCIYPMYDYAHPLGDAIEGITHSLCTLEFDNNREVYDWVVDNTHEPPVPHQYEFSRLNLDYTVMSKRKLLRIVGEGHVDGWDDPRMWTIAGLRRRGFTPSSIRSFVERAGVSKSDQRVDMSLLEYAIRDDLNTVAPRVMCVLDPLTVEITNWPKGKTDWIDAPYFPHDVPREGSREIPFSGKLVIERSDFNENPPKGYYRMQPGEEVRLRYGFVVRCNEVVKDADGNIERVLCTYDPATRGGDTPDGRRIRGTIHWVSADHGVPVTARLYDRLFTVADPDAEPDGFLSAINPDSIVVRNGLIEPSVANDEADTRYQFERLGYFWRDPVDSSDSALVFNRIVSLRDSWAKQSKGNGSPNAAAKPAEAASAQEENLAANPAAATPDKTPKAVSKGPRVTVDVSPEEAAALASRLGISEKRALLVAAQPGAEALLKSAIAAGAPADESAKWIINEIPAAAPDKTLEELAFDGGTLAKLIALVQGGDVSARAAKTVLTELAESGGDPSEIVQRLGLAQVSDENALRDAAIRVVESFPEKAAAYRDGKHGLIGFFIGRIMQETGGAANPGLARETLESVLSETV